jgi:predicted  nucleic acid-binding Zn-ribbon protein
MVAELKNQNADEIDKRDWCIEELNANERSTTHAYDTKANLEAKMADLEKTIEQLTADIKNAKDTIAETQTQMKRAGETREVENADYQQVVSDQTITQAILTKALNRMKEVYAFLEAPGAPHIQTSATRTDPGNGPAKFAAKEQNAGGKRVVAMIQGVIDDSQKTEDTAHATEADAQGAYEDMVKESNKSITNLTNSINDMTVSLAKAKEDLTMAKSDFATTMKELGGLNDYAGDLHKSCDYVLKNFDARQAARTAEIDALNEAKAILSGAQ